MKLLSRARSIFSSLTLLVMFVGLQACGGGGESPHVEQGSFDDGTLQGWTATGLWHISSTRTSNGSHSVRYANPITGTFHTDDGATPTPNATQNSGSLTSPPIALGSNPTLDFDFFLKNECTSTSSNYICAFDSLIVEVSNDNGTRFTRFGVLSETPEGFKTFKVDLYEYAQQTVLIRFTFDTYDEIGNDEEGAYIDNVVINNNTDLAIGPFPISMAKNLDVNPLSSLNIPLHFPFDFQGGTYSNVAITENGILDFGSVVPDITQTVTEFLSGNPRIAMLWNSMSPNEGGSISYQRTASSITFSFTNVSSNNFTATLSNDGSIVLDYGAISATSALVGLTPGGGVTDPGEADLSFAPSQLATGVTYENFTGGGTDDVDLSGTTVTFN